MKWKLISLEGRFSFALRRRFIDFMIIIMNMPWRIILKIQLERHRINQYIGKVSYKNSTWHLTHYSTGTATYTSRSTSLLSAVIPGDSLLPRSHPYASR